MRLQAQTNTVYFLLQRVFYLEMVSTNRGFLTPIQRSTNDVHVGMLDLETFHHSDKAVSGYGYNVRVQVHFLFDICTMIPPILRAHADIRVFLMLNCHPFVSDGSGFEFLVDKFACCSGRIG